MYGQRPSAYSIYDGARLESPTLWSRETQSGMGLLRSIFGPLVQISVPHSKQKATRSSLGS
jgi:hypothetical protein